MATRAATLVVLLFGVSVAVSPAAAGASSITSGPPAPPRHGALLGAWINPSGRPDSAVDRTQVANARRLGLQRRRRLGILHVYADWMAPAPLSALRSISDAGSTPLLDWHCGDTDANVIAGRDDALITAYAQALKSLDRPVFLRWFWEMNYINSGRHSRCLAGGGASGFVSAWRHVWSIFNSVGATNVAWVWSPGLAGTNPAPFYPGASYVNWIGVDGYNDRFQNAGTQAFTDMFSAFYNSFVGDGKPIMIAETGAPPPDQSIYLKGALAALPSYPAIEAFVYFDGQGPDGNWALQGSGIREFRSMASNSYFHSG